MHLNNSKLLLFDVYQKLLSKIIFKKLFWMKVRRGSYFVLLTKFLYFSSLHYKCSKKLYIFKVVRAGSTLIWAHSLPVRIASPDYVLLSN